MNFIADRVGDRIARELAGAVEVPGQDDVVNPEAGAVATIEIRAQKVR